MPPFVLAGPILRRVEPRRMSVWVALSEASTVGVKVWDGLQTSTGPGVVDSGDAPRGEATADTRRFGEHLHLAVVTVELEGGAALPPGQLYSYDVTFDGGAKSLRTENLLQDGPIPGADGDAPEGLALGYGVDQLPSFASCPASIGSLRIAQASCRKSTATGPDALAWLDGVVDDHRGDAQERPHQLVLTGDQIYADDLATLLLTNLTELGNTLVGANERVAVGEDTVEMTTGNFPAGRRRKLVVEEASFTTTAGANHLISFGEFCAMYLHAWSPAVWSDLGAVTVSDAERDDETTIHWPAWSPDDSALDGRLAEWRTCVDELPDEEEKKDFRREVNRRWHDANHKEVDELADYRDTVAQVRRLLANVPTYMIFDDHEVTDDWNITQEWVDRVSTTSLGATIVRNALTAFALFQAWGNDPERFADAGGDGGAGDGPEYKNAELLDAAERLFDGGAPRADAANDLAGLFGLDGSGSDIGWHFTVDGPEHRLAVLDTRTNRDFPGRFGPARLVKGGGGVAGLDTQLPADGLPGGLKLLVLVSAVPVLDPPIIDRVGHPIGVAAVDVVDAAVLAWTDLFGDSGVAACEARRPSPLHGSEAIDLESWFANRGGFDALLQRLSRYDKVAILSGDVHLSWTMSLDYWRDASASPSRIVQLTCSGARNAQRRLARTVIGRFGFTQTLLRAGLPLTDVKDDVAWRLDLTLDRRPDGDRPSELTPAGVGAEPPVGGVDWYGWVVDRHARALPNDLPMRQFVLEHNVAVSAFDDAGGQLRVREAVWSHHPDASGPHENTVHDVSLEPTTDARPSG